MKIISGGQTGADRAALDFAIQNGIPHGGWCPKGRNVEDGPIDAKYQLQETPSSDYPQRTEWNVRDSDGTITRPTATSVNRADLAPAASEQVLFFIAAAPVPSMIHTLEVFREPQSERAHGQRDHQKGQHFNPRPQWSRAAPSAHTELGLATCWIGWIRTRVVAKIVGWPASIKPVVVITVGYASDPDATILPATRRKPLADMVRWL